MSGKRIFSEGITAHYDLVQARPLLSRIVDNATGLEVEPPDTFDVTSTVDGARQWLEMTATLEGVKVTECVYEVKDPGDGDA